MSLPLGLDEGSQMEAAELSSRAGGFPARPPLWGQDREAQRGRYRQFVDPFSVREILGKESLLW